MQHPGGVTNTTRIQGHLDDLLFDRRRLPGRDKWSEVCQRGVWQDCLLVETVLAMLTLVSHFT